MRTQEKEKLIGRKLPRAELGLIAAIHARTQHLPAPRELIFGMGDDCAVLRPLRGEDLVMTTDLLLEDVHFRRAWHPPESVGHRALARGLSDLAAMGARPIAAYLSIALPADLAGKWFDRFLDGWTDLADRHQVPLAGGDTAEAPRTGGKPKMAADVVLVGGVPRGKALLRSGAHAGDTLYVTGKLGGAAVELRDLRRTSGSTPDRTPIRISKTRDSSRPHPHLFPQPRLAVGRRLLQGRLATAAIDLSDGLSTDLNHLCQASGLGAIVDRQAVPLAPGASLKDAADGGEDYELLFTAPPGRPLRSVSGIRVYPVGRMTPKAGSIELLAEDGSRAPFMPRGWQHFRVARLK